RGAAANVFAYGARATAHAGGEVWVSEVSPASSYLSSSDPRIHWGLGPFERLEKLVIRWPSGDEQTFGDVPADQFLRITEGKAIETLRSE
ncbi:MAG: ASPIC/UnbV domain-containing protein, partial [Candidatus Saccharimonadales bacterium]